ncbi:M16 family metallopeptidase [Streptomyces neyagawaensis]|uniref:M16 family metallopeptidase n=1 Tax=Streptomyces neyagawaensis TaxID=42238 RepID=UPI0006E25CF1|nr:pitrilysin family protein [Streptomyces neyagawaensis]MCL6736045.1 insulinase family protein [Streptomyces neyagawaensis]MDE1684133.1 insulinase family protein [Streptomyces neyagawaensis]
MSLRLVTEETPGRGLVAVALTVAAGGDDDPPGRHGMAHLVEHLMFPRGDGATTEGDTGFVALVQEAGGMCNAETHRDHTVLHTVVPADALPDVLALEARRLLRFRPEPATVRSETAVIAEEIRAAGAGARLWDTVLAALHPGARHAYGTTAELTGVTAEEAESFFRAHYRPERAVLSVVGDVDAGRVATLVEREFGAWAPGLPTAVPPAMLPAAASGRLVPPSLTPAAPGGLVPLTAPASGTPAWLTPTATAPASGTPTATAPASGTPASLTAAAPGRPALLTAPVSGSLVPLTTPGTRHSTALHNSSGHLGSSPRSTLGAPIPYARDGVAVGHALADPRGDFRLYVAQVVLCELLRRSRLPHLVATAPEVDAATVQCGYQGQWLASAAPDLALVLLGRVPGAGTEEAVGRWLEALGELAATPPGETELRRAARVLRAGCHRQSDSLPARAVTHARAALLLPHATPDALPAHLAAVTPADVSTGARALLAAPRTVHPLEGAAA